MNLHIAFFMPKQLQEAEDIPHNTHYRYDNGTACYGDFDKGSSSVGSLTVSVQLIYLNMNLYNLYCVPQLQDTLA